MSDRPADFKLLGPQKAMYGNAARYNLCIGAQGSGKSHDIGIRSALFQIYCPNVIGLIAANTYDQLSRATLLATFAAWKKYFGWEEYDSKRCPHGAYVISKDPPPHFKPHGYTFKTNNNNIYLANGGVIFTASLENYTGIEGIEIGWALLDETADTREEALTSVITGRLRQKGLSKCKGGWSHLFPFCPSDSEFADGDTNPLFIYTKPAKVPWLNEMFRLEDHQERIVSSVMSETDYFYNFDGLRQVVIYSVFHNKSNLPNGFIEERIKFLQGQGLIDSHIYGNPFAKTGGEFVSEFNKLEHVKRVSYEPGYPIHASFDFNSKPYMTCILSQLIQPEDTSQYWAILRIFKEYALEWPHNTAGHIGESVRNDWSDEAMYGLYIYGDASGNNAIPVKGVKSLFDDLLNSLGDLPYELRVPPSNPKYAAALGPGSMGRRAFINKLFSGSLGVKVEIDDDCKHMIADLTFVLEDANGKMSKKKNKDGVEEIGHHLDALQYKVCHPKMLGYLAKIK